MPKEPSAKLRVVRKVSSTVERRARADRVRSYGTEMVFRCKRCEEKELRCFVDTATGRCAGCIAVHAECSLFVSEEEWEKVETEKRETRLALLRVEAEGARLRLELANIESREQEFARRDLSVLKVYDQGKELEGPSTIASSSAVPTFANSS